MMKPMKNLYDIFKAMSLLPGLGKQIRSQGLFRKYLRKVSGRYALENCK